MMKGTLQGALGLAVFFGLVLRAPVGAQRSEQLSAEALRGVVDRVAEILEANYVFPEIGARYARTLRDEAAGYPPSTPSELASRITTDLQTVHQDLHLKLLPSAGGAGPMRVQVGGGGGRVRVRRGGDDAPSTDQAAEPVPVAATAEELFAPIDLTDLPEVGRALFDSEARRNHFFHEIEILPGNVGYLDYDQFGFPNVSTETADAAFAFLRECDALILDLRDNPGGIEGMNQYLASHFFGKEPVHLYSRFYGSARITLDYMTFPDRVAHRFPDLPLFILVNGGTGSAAENFTYALQGLGRATVVGRHSAGAAHSSRVFEVSSGFQLQTPIARAYNPRTGEDWEGEGVRPDIEAEESSALAVAHAAAVDRLLEGASGEERLALEDARLLFAARDADPGSGDPEQYEGEYGNRRVYVEGGALKMARTDVQGVPSVDLVPLAPDYFTLRQASFARIRFERDDAGEILRMHVRTPTGTWEVGERR